MTNDKIRKVEFDEKIVEQLKDIFNKARVLEQQLVNGVINEDEFIRLSRELKFNIPDDRKRAYIDNVWDRASHENESDDEFKERVINKLGELGIRTMSMRKEK